MRPTPLWHSQRTVGAQSARACPRLPHMQLPGVGEKGEGQARTGVPGALHDAERAPPGGEGASHRVEGTSGQRHVLVSLPVAVT